MKGEMKDDPSWNIKTKTKINNKLEQAANETKKKIANS